MNTRTRLRPTFIFALFLAACVSAELTPTALPDTPAVADTPTPLPTPTPTEAPLTTETRWWNDTVFYEVFVRSFKDSNGDGVGDFNGLIEKLDYLNDGDPATTTDLGVTGLWLMPITESPSYHGYDVVDYYAVDQEYGTREDFRRLLEEAHKRGIRIIVDLVLNHTALDNPWFKASNAGDPDYRDWYIWADPAPSFRGPWGQRVWYEGQDGYYYALFWSGMPDLNLENPQVTAEIYEIARFWLEDMNVDGFRLDAIRHFVESGSVQENTPATHAWLQGFNKHYKSLDPQAFTVGEAWTETAQVLDYVGDEVDIAFEFDLAASFVRAANGPLAGSATKQLQSVVNNYPPGQFGTFLTNHDQNRVMSLLKDPQKAKLAAVMMLTAPGVPFIYYGEEIGMTGLKPDENIRRPMQWTGEDSNVGFSTQTPWNAASADYQVTNVAAQTDDPDSLLNLYRTLIRLRAEHAALRTGETLIIDADTQRLYAILRYNDQEAFLILVNVDPRPLTADLYNLTLEQGPFTGALKAVSVLGLSEPAAPAINGNGGFTGYLPFQEIPAHSAVIVQLTPQ